MTEIEGQVLRDRVFDSAQVSVSPPALIIPGRAYDIFVGLRGLPGVSLGKHVKLDSPCGSFGFFLRS
jgi:hypothetical protein